MTLDDRFRAAADAVVVESASLTTRSQYRRWQLAHQRALACPAADRDLDTTLQFLALAEVAYLAGKHYQDRGDHRTALLQFHFAAAYGVGDLEGCAALRSATADSVTCEPPDAEEAERRPFLQAAAGLVMGSTPKECIDVDTNPLPAITPGLLPNETSIAHVVDLEEAANALRRASEQETTVDLLTALITNVWLVEQLRQGACAPGVYPRLSALAAELHNSAGWALFDVGAVRSCRDHFGRALAHAVGSGDNHMAANVLYRMGRIYLHLGAPQEAIKIFQLGQLAAQELGSALIMALLFLNEGWAYEGLGRPDQAERVWTHARAEMTRAADQLPELSMIMKDRVLLDSFGWLERSRDRFPGPDLQDVYQLLDVDDQWAS